MLTKLKDIKTSSRYCEKEIKQFFRHCKIPDDFNQWNERIFNCYKDLHYTVAHMAAEHGILPAHFNQWQIRDKLGRSVFLIHQHFLAKYTIDYINNLTPLQKEIHQQKYLFYKNNSLYQSIYLSQHLRIVRHYNTS